MSKTMAEVRVKRDSVYQTFSVSCDENMSVAHLLELINMSADDPVEWECSCRQNQCGSCAMVINGRPALACATFVAQTGTEITLEPLSKFPFVRDLRVDRGMIQKMLIELQAYPAEGASADYRDNQLQYLASSCMHCGCCMEACPNFHGRGGFGSALAANAMFRTVSQEKDPERHRELTRKFRKSQYKDCSKALSCADVCPMNIPQEKMISCMNRMMLRDLFGRRARNGK